MAPQMAPQIGYEKVKYMTRRQYGTGTLYRQEDGRWVGQLEAGWTRAGTRRRIKVSYKPKPGESDRSAEAEVKRRMQAKRRAIETDGMPASSRSPTVKQWTETWLEMSQHRLRPKTWANYRSTVAAWIVPIIGRKRLDKLGPGDVRSVADAQRKAGRSSQTMRHTHTVLIRCLREAIAEGHTVPQRVLLVTAPTAGESDRDAIAIDDALALLEAASGHPDGSRWVAALLQGMRQGECLGLTWDAVDLTRGTVDVSWQLQALPYESGRAGRLRIPDGYEHCQLDGALSLTRPKTGKGRRLIPLVPWMTSALTAWREAAPESPHGLVWPRADGRPQTSREDRHAWYALQDEAQVSGPGGRRILLHEARHTCATLLLEGGIDPETVKTILGHSSILVSRGYQHVSPALARQALEQVAGRLGLSEGTEE